MSTKISLLSAKPLRKLDIGISSHASDNTFAMNKSNKNLIKY